MSEANDEISSKSIKLIAFTACVDKPWVSWVPDASPRGSEEWPILLDSKSSTMILTLLGNPFDTLHSVGWDELIRTSDFVSIHCPLTEETRGLFNETTLRSMKPSAVLVNTSRGALVCNSALDKALREGWIAGAGLDNLETEPPDWNDPLLSAPNLLVTPHVAFYSEESLKDLQRLTAQAVADIFRRQTPEGLLNPEILPMVLQRLDSDG